MVSHGKVRASKGHAACTVYICQHAWGEGGGQVGQEGQQEQYWQQCTLLKESGCRDIAFGNTFHKGNSW